MNRSPCFEGWIERSHWGRKAKADAFTYTNLGHRHKQQQQHTHCHNVVNRHVKLTTALSATAVRQDTISPPHVIVPHTSVILKVPLTSGTLPIS
jgi:hypothetical protein